MKPVLRILHIEDNPNDAELIKAKLEKDGITHEMTRVETHNGFISAISQCDFDLLLVDFNLPGFDGFSALDIAKEKCPDIPLIFVSGAIGEEQAVEILKNGATDYVMKENLSRLPSSVRRALKDSEDRDLRKQGEEDREKLQAQLNQAQKMESIGTLAGGIAHDFNNILFAIIGYTELALMKTEAESEIQAYLQDVLTAGERAKYLVNQILTFSRHAKTEKKPVQIGLMAKEALKLLRASLPSTIEIRESILSKSLVLCDPTQIHQIVMNICINAAHAMRDNGGVLEVKLSDVELDSVFVSAYPQIQPGPYIRLTIQDTGHGMTPEVKNHIFDPFFTTKDKSEGTGLGLSVVHGIVQDCGGEIDVYSQPDQGTIFVLYFPAVQRKHDDKPVAHRSLPMGTEHILCVDDARSIADILTKMLSSLGYTVAARTSSLEALALFKTMPDKFDLVITDMTMPQMTGDTLAREMMKIRPDIPVILCTGFSEKISKESAESMGIKAFLMKPLLRDETAHTVRSVLDSGVGRNDCADVFLRKKTTGPTAGRTGLYLNEESDDAGNE